MKTKTTVLAIVILIAAGWLALRPRDHSGGSAMGASIRGAVTDEEDKPVRGAIVKATLENKSISRLTDQAGQYRITGLEPGNWVVSASAWAFAPSTEIQSIEAGQSAEASFRLKDAWDVHRISTTDWLTFLPEDRDVLALEAACLGCHSLNPIIDRRGLTAAQWSGLILGMGSSFIIPRLPAPRLAYISSILEKHFGPDSALPAREQIQRPPISDAALQVTYREYVIPTKSKPHSLTVDSKGNVWFGEYDYFSNQIGRFDIQTETFQEYPISTPKAAPHTLAVAEDGRVWVTMSGARSLGVVDPQTGEITEYPGPTPSTGSHIPAIDSVGNIWFTEGATANKVAKFDPRTEEFEEFLVPVPKTIPEDTSLSAQTAAGEQTPERIETFPYGISVDSQDKVWFSLYNTGKVLKLDPATGEFTEYEVPGMAAVRGVGVDSQDYVWFANFLGHKLGKLDPNTGEITQYLLPTRHATPYGLLVAKSGHIWVSDFSGNQLTRFNPETEEFTEYPLPTFDAISRFLGEDAQGRIWFPQFWTGKIGSLDPG